MVAEMQSFTLAADKLDVSKGLVSRHVQKLERDLNVKLFYRTTRSIRVTEAGEALYAKARQIQLLAVEAEIQLKDMTQEISGDLKITAPLELGRILSQQVIPQFCLDYPDINLFLDCDHAKKQIELGDYDVALRADDALPQDVIAKRLGTIRNVLVCSEQYLEHHPMPTLDNIHQCRFILNSRQRGWSELELVHGDKKATFTVMGRLHCNTYSAIAELATAGSGLASLPFYQVEEHIRCGKLIHILPKWSVQSQCLSLIYAQHRVTPQKLIRFNRAVMQWFKSSGLYLL